MLFSGSRRLYVCVFINFRSREGCVHQYSHTHSNLWEIKGEVKIRIKLLKENLSNYSEAPTFILRLKKIEVTPKLPVLVVEKIALGPIAIVLNAQ